MNYEKLMQAFTRLDAVMNSDIAQNGGTKCRETICNRAGKPALTRAYSMSDNITAFMGLSEALQQHRDIDAETLNLIKSIEGAARWHKPKKGEILE